MRRQPSADELALLRCSAALGQIATQMESDSDVPSVIIRFYDDFVTEDPVTECGVKIYINGER